MPGRSPRPRTTRRAPAKVSKPAKVTKPPARVTAPVVRLTRGQSDKPLLKADPVEIAVDAGVKSIPVAIDAGRIEQGLAKVKDEVNHWVNKGKYTRVRIKVGKYQILPDIPIALAVAAEGVSFLLAGPLQAILANVVGQTVLNVELVSDALHHVSRGRELILAGELEQAMTQFRTAVAIDRGCAPAHLSIGIALKLQGDREGARLSFEKATRAGLEGAGGPRGREDARHAAVGPGRRASGRSSARGILTSSLEGDSGGFRRSVDGSPQQDVKSRPPTRDTGKAPKRSGDLEDLPAHEARRPALN